MARFVGLVNWTDQGIRDYRSTVDRAAAFEQLVQKMGGAIHEILWTVGPYDIVVTMEAPDDETATAALLAIGSMGNVRTTSMRAFTRDEVGEIVRKATA